jgi:MFS family permease
MFDTYHERRVAPPELRRARVAVFAVFAAAGLLVGMWSGTIPLVAARAGVSAGVLGVVILLSSVGIVAGAQLGGRLQGRVGGIPLCIGGLATASFGAVAMAFAGDAGVLACAMTIFSFGMGLNDVGMNMQAVIVERAYGRPIMSSFHAFFSLGGAAGALIVLGTALLGWTARPQLGFAAALCTVAVCVAAGWLVRQPQEAVSGNDSPTMDAAAGLKTQRAASAPSAADEVVRGPAGWPDFVAETALPARRVSVRTPWSRVALMLAVCALLLFFTEGVATDWSALQLTQAFGAAAGVSAFGYGVFAVMMTGGRLLVDRVVVVFGPVAVVRGGAVIGAVGMAAVLVAPSIWVALAGWALLGVGLCGCVPQVFSAAGNQPHSAVVLSRVLTFGYVGIFGGPALIGLLASVTSVTVALVAPFAALVLAAVLAGAVRRGPRTAERRERPSGVAVPQAE